MNSLTTAWITHPACGLHEMDAGHPESPARLAAIQDRLLARGVLQLLHEVEAREATREELLRAHTPAHVQQMLDMHVPSGSLIRVDPDTSMGPYTLKAALRAAGAAVQGVDMVLAGEAGLAFCAVRPPGHHAERDRAMGFCFFNNIAVAAAHALAQGLQRVAVLDFDVHYGNGTADIFRDDPRVLMCSTYQDPLYPYWAGKGTVRHLIDVSLPPGADGALFRDAVAANWLPALQRFQPQIILVSAGFDAHRADPLAQLRLTEDDFRWIGRVIRDVAAACAGNRVVATLEGGYDVDALARSVEAFLLAFLGDYLPT
jgi:acetoin utilization deacetylase AcuC-like enzyme